LATGTLLNLPTALVTNGVFLADAADLMAVLAPTKIAISLDAASAAIHDRVRGVPGVWATTVAGIERPIKVLTPRTRLAVSSVLLPGKRRYLDSMSARLSEIGVDRWIVNPRLGDGAGQVGGLVHDRASLFDDFLILQKSAERVGIGLTADDEFDHLGYGPAGIHYPALRSLHMRTLPRNVEIFRLAPNGQCSTGEDIIKPATLDVPPWQPNITNGSRPSVIEPSRATTKDCWMG
jgi:hypothetical protein